MEKNKLFMLTGFSDSEKQRLALIIDQLGGILLGNLHDPQGFDNRCTHLVTRKPRRSQKCMCACVKGCWILNVDYLNNSMKMGLWLDENDFEWKESKCATPDEVTFVKEPDNCDHTKSVNVLQLLKCGFELCRAAKRWRRITKHGTENLPFQGWLVGSALNTSFKIYQRFIEVGGGKAYNLKNDGINQNFTHILANPCCKTVLEQWRKNGIPCVKSEFLARWILQETPPLAKDYSIFDDDLPIVALLSHATQRKSGNDCGEETLTEHQHNVAAPTTHKSETEERANFLIPTTSTLLHAVDKECFNAVDMPNPYQIESETEIYKTKIVDTIGQADNLKTPKVPNLNTPVGVFRSKCDDVTTNTIDGELLKSRRNSIDQAVSDIMEILLHKLTTHNCAVNENAVTTDAANDECFLVSTNNRNSIQDSQCSDECAASSYCNNEPALGVDVENSDGNINICINNQEVDSEVIKMECIENSNELKDSNARVPNSNVRDSDNEDFVESSQRCSDSPVAVYVSDSPSDTDQSSDESETGNISELTDQTDQVFSQNSLHEIENRSSVIEPNVMSRTEDRVIDDVTVENYHEIPEWLKEKRDLLKSALLSIVQKNDSQTKRMALHHSQQRDVSSGIRAQRFSENEIRILQNYVKSDHWRSVLLFCRMYLSSSAYPTHDLLYLIMKLYVLNSDDMNQTHEFVSFLNSVFLYHHPSTSHIRNDDVYLQAMSVTYCTESSLLLGSGINAAFARNLWSNPRQESPEWMFFSSIVTAALSCNDTQRKANATLLITFLSTVIESNPRIVRALFFYKDMSIVTPSVKLLLTWIRKAIDLAIQENSDDEIYDVTDINSHNDVTTDFDSSLNDDGFENDDYVVDPNDLEQSLMKILKAFIRLLERFGGSSFKRVSYLLSQEFVDANSFTLERLFSMMTLRIITSTITFLLEEKCKTDLAKIKEKNCELSLQTLVERYFYFIPKFSSVSVNNTPPKTKLNDSSGSTKSDISLAKDTTHEEVYLLDNGMRLTPSSVNKTNTKGETLLHRSCIKNHPQVVAQMLKIPGVNPNLGDHVGWTALGEACNHGNVQCVKELLRLPLGVVGSGPDQTTPPQPLYIDLLACPDEGVTPLHDAISCSHLEVAKLLVEKGGIDLMYVTDKKGRTALDYCTAEYANVFLGRQDSEIYENKKQKLGRTENFTESIDYKKLLPPCYLMSTAGWKKSCDDYVILLRHLLKYYVILTDLNTFILALCKSMSDDVTDDDRFIGVVTFYERNITTDMTSLYESDIFYVLKWKQIEEKFLQHVRKLSGNIDYVIEKKFSVFSDETLNNLNNIFPSKSSNK